MGNKRLPAHKQKNPGQNTRQGYPGAERFGRDPEEHGGPAVFKRMLPKILIILVLVAGVIWVLRYWMIQMPGRSAREPIPALNEQQSARAIRLRDDLSILTREIGERNLTHAYRQLKMTEEWLAREMERLRYRVTRQAYQVQGQEVVNVEAVKEGVTAPEEILVIGAHYDSVPGSVGANDNGSGVVALLELARMLHDEEFARTVRLVAFVNEEMPYFLTGEMGSRVYALGCKRLGEDIRLMLCLETLGYYSQEPGSQKYPTPLDKFYPNTGNFLAFVGNLSSREQVHRSIEVFRETSALPSEGVAAPSDLPGIGLSDHSSFWLHGYPAIMLTDTAMYRYPYYHTADDTMENVDFDRLALAVEGIAEVIRHFAGQPDAPPEPNTESAP
jgi:hypothetical protein